uniref:carboxylesterase 1D-like n=1 Tax=Myodes glareolus TaxID=447135 RepID=UPI002022161D|nr:carboxylesterase 1D-like [Myodes glareolus]
MTRKERLSHKERENKQMKIMKNQALLNQHPSSPPVVNTAHGKVLGKYVSLKGFAQPVAVFLGVPFAKPPLRSLRFAPPQPAEPWSFVKNATSYPPMCFQDAAGGQMLSELFTNRKENIPLQFSEDCLYLNIYTPANLTKNSQLPVMVWIHGGGLMIGGTSMYDGLALSAHEDVVVVTIQYRLGVWGLLSPRIPRSPRNCNTFDGSSPSSSGRFAIESICMPSRTFLCNFQLTALFSVAMTLAKLTQGFLSPVPPDSKENGRLSGKE